MNPVIAEILALAVQLAEADGPQLIQALTELLAQKSRAAEMDAAVKAVDASVDAAEAAAVATSAKLP